MERGIEFMDISSLPLAHQRTIIPHNGRVARQSREKLVSHGERIAPSPIRWSVVGGRWLAIAIAIAIAILTFSRLISLNSFADPL